MKVCEKLAKYLKEDFTWNDWESFRFFVQGGSMRLLGTASKGVKDYPIAIFNKERKFGCCGLHGVEGLTSMSGMPVPLMRAYWQCIVHQYVSYDNPTPMAVVCVTRCNDGVGPQYGDPQGPLYREIMSMGKVVAEWRNPIHGYTFNHLVLFWPYECEETRAYWDNMDHNVYIPHLGTPKQ